MRSMRLDGPMGTGFGFLNYHGHRFGFLENRVWAPDLSQKNFVAHAALLVQHLGAGQDVAKSK